jgi:hypothetical protein
MAEADEVAVLHAGQVPGLQAVVLIRADPLPQVAEVGRVDDIGLTAPGAEARRWSEREATGWPGLPRRQEGADAARSLTADGRLRLQLADDRSTDQPADASTACTNAERRVVATDAGLDDRPTDGPGSNRTPASTLAQPADDRASSWNLMAMLVSS